MGNQNCSTCKMRISQRGPRIVKAARAIPSKRKTKELKKLTNELHFEVEELCCQLKRSDLRRQPALTRLKSNSEFLHKVLGSGGGLNELTPKKARAKRSKSKS